MELNFVIQFEKEYFQRRKIKKKGKSNSRWIVSGKLRVVLNKFGLVAGFATEKAKFSDKIFNPMLKKYEKEMITFSLFQCFYFDNATKG